MQKEKLKVVKITSVNNTTHIGANIFKELSKCCIIIPYNQICYLILLEDNKTELPETMTIFHITQKPSIFLVQPIAENLEIEVTKIDGNSDPVFIMMDEFVEYIEKKYNIKSDEVVQKIGNGIINSLKKFIDFRPY